MQEELGYSEVNFTEELLDNLEDEFAYVIGEDFSQFKENNKYYFEQ